MRKISLTDFQRNAKAYLERIRRSGRPIVLTVNGKAAAVVHDARAAQSVAGPVGRLRGGRARPARAPSRRSNLVHLTASVGGEQLLCSVTAIDRESLAGDEQRTLGAEPDDDARDLFRLSDASNGMGRYQHLRGCVEGVGDRGASAQGAEEFRLRAERVKPTTSWRAATSVRTSGAPRAPVAPATNTRMAAASIARRGCAPARRFYADCMNCAGQSQPLPRRCRCLVSWQAPRSCAVNPNGRLIP
jgi:prevent-host-death family protein